jgi:hypothetical protein
MVPANREMVNLVLPTVSRKKVERGAESVILEPPTADGRPYFLLPGARSGM